MATEQTTTLPTTDRPVISASDVPPSTQPHFLFPGWVWSVVLFLLFALLTMLVFGLSRRGDTFEQRRAAARLEKLKTTREEAAKALESYAWADKAKGVVRLPISRAIELTMADLRARKVSAGNPIAPADVQNPATQSGAAAPSATPGAAAPPSASATPRAIEVEGPNSENRNQPAGAANPPNVAPRTQPGAHATPAASPGAPADQPIPNATARPTPVQSPPGTPIPVRGAPQKQP